MATVDDGLKSQLRNIETSTGRSIDSWVSLIRATGLTRHGQIVAWLKSEHDLPHGAANRLALTALAADTPGSSSDPVEELYSGRSAEVRAIHDRLWAEIERLGDVEVSPKKGYLSLRRRIQFAMVKPAARHVDLGLSLPDEAVTDRLESAAT